MDTEIKLLFSLRHQKDVSNHNIVKQRKLKQLRIKSKSGLPHIGPVVEVQNQYLAPRREIGLHK